MQEGIGRGGYRVLGIVFFVVGGLALAGTVYAFNRDVGDAFNPIMAALSAIALCGVFILLLIVLRRLPGTDAAKGATFTPTGPPTPVAPAREINFDFEVEDDTPEEADKPGTIRPFGRDLPEVPKRAEPRLPPNRNLDADTKGWPKRKGPTGVTRGEMKVLREKEKVREKVARMDEDAGEALVLPLQPKPAGGTGGRTQNLLPGQTPSTGRPAMGIAKADVVEARMAFPNTTVPAGMARGKCGSCQVNLYAPTKRPLHLRCPSCGKVTSLS